MKKEMCTIVLVGMLGVLPGCGAEVKCSYPSSIEKNFSSTEIETRIENAAAPNIMINDRLYHTTGELPDGRFHSNAKDIDYNEKYEVDGAISSSVERYKLPEKNNQSNFGSGYEYHIINKDNILVKQDGLWIRFSAVENPLKEVGQ